MPFPKAAEVQRAVHDLYGQLPTLEQVDAATGAAEAEGVVNRGDDAFLLMQHGLTYLRTGADDVDAYLAEVAAFLGTTTTTTAAAGAHVAGPQAQPAPAEQPAPAPPSPRRPAPQPASPAPRSRHRG